MPMRQKLIWKLWFDDVLQKGVVHRDLKLENILLDDNGNIKVHPDFPLVIYYSISACSDAVFFQIADFGLSNLYHKDKLLKRSAAVRCTPPLRLWTDDRIKARRYIMN